MLTYKIFITITSLLTLQIEWYQEIGLKGVVVGQGDTYEEALSDVKPAIRFHIESFGEDVFEIDPPILEAFVAEAGV